MGFKIYVFMVSYVFISNSFFNLIYFEGYVFRVSF